MTHKITAHAVVWSALMIVPASLAHAQSPEYTASFEATTPDFDSLDDADFDDRFCAGGSLADASNDRPNMFGYRNLVGNGTDAALSFLEDGTFAYFRLRLGASIVQKSWNCPAQPDDYLEPHNWSVQLDLDHDATTYEVALVVRDSGVELWANPDADSGKPPDDPSDQPEVLVFALPASQLCTHLEVKAADTHIGSGNPSGNEDWFATVAIALTDLHETADYAIAEDVSSPLTGAFGLWASAGESNVEFLGDRTCRNDRDTSTDPLVLSDTISDPAIVGTFVDLVRWDAPQPSTTPTITGTTEIGATVALTIRDQGDAIVEMQSLSEDGSGIFTYTIATELASGASYQVEAVATDTETTPNTSQDSIALTIDTTAPSVTIASPQSYEIIRMADLTLSGAVGDSSTAIVQVTVTDEQDTLIVSGAAATVSGSGWTLALSDLTDRAVYTVDVLATDAAGHDTATNSTFEVRTTVEPLTISSPTDGRTIADGTPRVTGRGEPEASVVVTVDDASYGPVTVNRSGDWSLDIEDALGVGRQTVTARQTLGSDVTERSIAIEVDTSVALAVGAPAEDGVIHTQYPVFAGTCEAGALIELWLDETALGSVTSDGSGSFEFAVAGIVTAGTHTLKVQAQDAVGNIAVVERSFKVHDPSTDSDGDGLRDLDEDLDGDGDPENDDTDGDGTPNYLDDDDDNDGVPTAAGFRDDSDHDGILDYLDPDDDNDGILTRDELEHPNSDMDGDGLVDYLDPDDDGDGIPTAIEILSEDSDDDGLMDYLDPDDDGDGIPTAIESKGDSDEDGQPDFLDRDDDGDGIPTASELELDADQDGIPDHLDNQVEPAPEVPEGNDAGVEDEREDRQDEDDTASTPGSGCSAVGANASGWSEVLCLLLGLFWSRRRAPGGLGARRQTRL